MLVAGARLLIRCFAADAYLSELEGLTAAIGLDARSKLASDVRESACAVLED
jgi:hypothetical protein